MKPIYILGISAFYHDSAAALIADGEILAAAQEERFSRRKFDQRFPIQAAKFCLDFAGLKPKDLACIAFYDKPKLKFERIIETYLAFAPIGIRQFLSIMPGWKEQKMCIPDILFRHLGYEGSTFYPEHHESHAASAFFPSPFERSAFLAMDGVGEWVTSSWGVGNFNELVIQNEINFPHSLGLLYSAFTSYTGFMVNSGEYKVMGLAPYGEPKYKKIIYKNLIDVNEDGSFHLNMDYFDFCTGFNMTGPKFHELFGGPPRRPETVITQREMDLARSVQEVTEEIMMKVVNHIKKTTGEKNLCLAGGVALNCVCNGKILKSKLYENIWVQPSPGDAGAALGAALAIYHLHLKKKRSVSSGHDKQKGSYLGPEFSDHDIQTFFTDHSLPYHKIKDPAFAAAELIAQEKVVGWFQGRMEFGPRALGNRSILGDARSETMQSKMNLKIKFRESFRPFAPSVLEEDISYWFEVDRPDPYMLFVADVCKRHLIDNPEFNNAKGIDKLKLKRSSIPAVTHVDNSARIQSVNKETNPLFHRLLTKFKEITGCPVIVNTSFNVRGEPIVQSVLDAYKCFMRTDMDFLIIGSFILKKDEQPEKVASIEWEQNFELD